MNFPDAGVATRSDIRATGSVPTADCRWTDAVPIAEEKSATGTPSTVPFAVFRYGISVTGQTEGVEERLDQRFDKSI